MDLLDEKEQHYPSTTAMVGLVSYINYNSSNVRNYFNDLTVLICHKKGKKMFLVNRPIAKAGNSVKGYVPVVTSPGQSFIDGI